MLFTLMVPGVVDELQRRRSRRAFVEGQAAGYLMKAGGTPEATYSLSGRLYLAKSGWLLLSVPNSLVRGIFSALDEHGIELPPGHGDGPMNAHVSVMHEKEVEKIGPDAISERGKTYRYNIGRMEVVEPSGWPEMSKVYFVTIRSPDLETLRKSYGLEPLLKGHPFHISAAVRRRNVLARGDVSKAASGLIALMKGEG